MVPAGGVALEPSAQARAMEAYRLKIVLGKTYPEVATILGYGSPSAAWRAVEAALAWIQAERPLEKILDEEVAHLDAMRERILEQKHLTARDVEVLTKVAERKARLLGLDAPEKKLIAGQFDIEARITEATPDFVADVLRELSQTNPRALAAHTGESLDTAQADSQASRVSARRSA